MTTNHNQRAIEYDIMRILACFCVIMIHVAVFGQSELYTQTPWKQQSIMIWGVLSRWAVPAFVMLSGMLLLPKADTMPISKLLIHRVFRMLVAYVIWSAVYSAYNVFVLGIIYAPTPLKTFIDGCFSGEIHMWYIPMLAGLYFASPILSTLVKALNEKWTLYWLTGMLLFSSIIPFLVKLDIEFFSTVIASVNGYMELQFLGGWTLYFVLGYYIHQHSFTKRHRAVVYTLAVLSLLFTLERTILYALKTGHAYGIQNYEYPNIYLMGIGIMVFFKEEISRIHFNDRTKSWISAVSKLTFGIYLSHVLLLKVLYALGINLQLAHPALSVPIVSLIVFMTGAALTWILHKIPVIGMYIA